MNLECVVWDGDRKSKRYTVEAAGTQARQRLLSTSRASSEAQASQDDSIQRNVARPKVHDDEILSPFYPFQPTFGPTSDGPDGSDGQGKRNEPPLQMDDEQRGAEVHPSMSLRSAAARDFDRCIRFMSMLRRPLLMHVTILARQNLFRCGTPPGPRLDDDSASVQLKTLLDTIPADAMDVCGFGLLMHHAHLVPLSEAIEMYRTQPSCSRALLACTMMYLCRVWQANPDVRSPLAQMPFHLLRLIRHFGLQVVSRTPRCLEAAQSLELLAVYMPFILQGDAGDDADGRNSDGARCLYAGEDCAAAGASFIATAMNIASALGCDPRAKTQPKGTLSNIPWQRKRLLWTSLCCWQLSLSFHEPHAATPTETLIEQSLTPFSAGGKDTQVGSRYSVAELIGYAACAALEVRCRAIWQTSETELEIERAVNADLPNEEFKERQTAIMQDYLEASQDFAAQRLTTLDSVLALLSECCKEERAQAFVPIIQHTWHWLEMDARGFHEILLSKALGNVHVQIMHNVQRKAQQIPDSTSGKGMGYTARTFLNSQIWSDPVWGQHIYDLGVRRNKDIVDLLSRACRFKQLADAHQHAMRSLVRSNGQQQLVSSLMLPIPTLSAVLMSATKTLMDSQSVVLQSMNHVHPDTDSYVVIIRQLADVLEHDMDVIAMRQDGTHESGIAQCTAGILRIAAHTMVAWQDRQGLVLARHREQRKQKRAHALAPEERSPVSTMLTTPSDTPGHTKAVADRLENGNSKTLPASKALLHDPTLTAEPLYNPAGLFDGAMPSIDSFFAGIMEIPGWNEVIDSLELQQY